MTSAVKDPDEVLDFRLVWTKELTALGPDTIATSTWLPPAGISVGAGQRASTHEDTSTTVWLSGGTLGARYDVVNRITTTGGRTYDGTLTVTILKR